MQSGGSKMSHNERCKECKVRVRELLEKIYGTVIVNYRISLPTRPEDFRDHPHYAVLNRIYSDLQKHRGFTEFVRASYVDVDFFVPDPGFIVEFDESQHFTEPRKITLAHYPSDVTSGFSREVWMKHCDEIRTYDNDPPFRDEQRAWYDTLRDFIPEIKGFQPTVRLYVREMEWCKFDPENPGDVMMFKNLLTIPSESEIDLLLDQFEASLQDVKTEYLEWAGDRENQGIGAPENNAITMEFLKSHSRQIKTASMLLQQIRNYCHTIADPKIRYRIIREVYCIQPSFHEMWFFDRHFSLFYEPRLGGIYSRPGLKSISTSIKNGKFAGRINGVSTFLLKWVILLDNLYAGKTERSLFDFPPVDDAKLLQNIRYLQKNPNPNVSEVIEDLPIIYETVHTLLQRTGYSSLNPDIILHDDKILMYAPCAINEGPMFHKTSRDSRSIIFKKAMSGDRSLIRKTLSEHFTILPVATDEKKPSVPSLVTRASGTDTSPEFSRNVLKTPAKNTAVRDIEVSNFYHNLCKKLDPLFGDMSIDQKTKYTYRGKNEIGYPGKKALDMIALFKHSNNKSAGVKVRIYPFVLASHIGETDLNRILNGLPEHFLPKKERGNSHPCAIFYEGSFANEGEIEKFLKSIVSV